MRELCKWQNMCYVRLSIILPETRELFSVDVRRSLIWEILHGEGIHPYRFQIAKGLIRQIFLPMYSFHGDICNRLLYSPTSLRTCYSQIKKCSLERVCLKVNVLMFGNMTTSMWQYLMFTSTYVVLMCERMCGCKNMWLRYTYYLNTWTHRNTSSSCNRFCPKC